MEGAQDHTTNHVRPAVGKILFLVERRAKPSSTLEGDTRALSEMGRDVSGETQGASSETPGLYGRVNDYARARIKAARSKARDILLFLLRAITHKIRSWKE